MTANSGGDEIDSGLEDVASIHILSLTLLLFFTRTHKQIGTNPYFVCETATLVSVPFTKGRYYGEGERPSAEQADNGPYVSVGKNGSLHNTGWYSRKVQYSIDGFIAPLNRTKYDKHKDASNSPCRIFIAGAFIASPELRAYAANTIGSSDIIDESIQSINIKDGQVKAIDLDANSVTSEKILEWRDKGS